MNFFLIDTDSMTVQLYKQNANPDYTGDLMI